MLPLLVLIIAALLLAGPALAGRVRRHRQVGAGGDAAILWKVLEADAVDVGHGWDPTQSPRPAAERLARERALPAPAAEALKRLAAAAERARYARAATAGATAHGLAAADLATCRAALLASCSRPARWRAVLLPPSTVTWAGGATSAALTSLGQRTDRLAAGLRRRRLAVRPGR